jgi:gluconate kinase
MCNALNNAHLTALKKATKCVNQLYIFDKGLTMNRLSWIMCNALNKAYITALKKATKGINQLYIFDKGLTMNRLL